MEALSLTTSVSPRVSVGECSRPRGEGTPPTGQHPGIGTGGGKLSPLVRAWTYQRERFPLAAHGPLIVAFSLSAVCFSRLLRDAPGWPPVSTVAVAFVTSLCAFLHLRIADEFKDCEEDARYRPYRPVPRGLVTLRELGWVWAGTAAVQLLLAFWHAPRLGFVLLGSWVYLALMSKEFFVREWLVARPITYLWTHMLIMPLVDFYATACDWAGAGQPVPAGLPWFLAASLGNGVVLEIGRKIRPLEREEIGVPTYSKLWGMQRAAAIWLAAMAVTGICGILAAQRIGIAPAAAGGLGVLWLAAAVLAARFVARPDAAGGRRLEAMAGVWTLGVYLILGILPMAWKSWS